MGSEAARQSAPREAEVQCLVRDENEAVERVERRAREGSRARTLRCECGDPSCQARVAPTHAEYEAVRAYGSHFLISLNHENPENTWVLCENARFAVIDVVAGDARYQVLGGIPGTPGSKHEIGVPNDGPPPARPDRERAGGPHRTRHQAGRRLWGTM